MPTAAPTVCVIDDEREVCDLLRLLLESRDFRCIVAHDGRSGLEAVRRHRPNAIVLDVMMPEMNGHDVLVELRKDPDLREIPVLMMTGLTEGDRRTDEEWCALLGVRAFISKPLHLDKLLERLDRLLGEAAKS
jgi:CheY-like chemotaxis protein